MRLYSHLGLGLVAAGSAFQVYASDFSLPFVNSAGLGVAYADWASAAADASTAYTNPAGLVKLKRPEMVINLLGVTGDATFTGSSQTPSFPFPAPIIESGVAKTRINAMIPSFYFSSPMSDRLTLGLSATGPFGLGTYFNKSSIVRYAATKSKVVAMDIGPSVGYKINDKFSIGAGIDLVRLAFTLNNMYGPPFSMPGDALLENKLTGWGVSWHAGVLADLTESTRVGFSFHDKISFTTRGRSAVYLPAGNVLATDIQRSDVALPSRAQLSIQQALTPKWEVMGTAFYTHWKTFRQVVMQYTQTPVGAVIPVTLPFNYHNCFDYALGSSYKVSDNLLLRAGILFFNTPSNNVDRGVGDPIGSATIATLGLQFKPVDHLKVDLGLGHSFFDQMSIRYRNPLTALNGYTNAQTTAIGAQFTWEIV